MAKFSNEILPIFIKLKDKGVTEVAIIFSGGGDSGDIDDIELSGSNGYLSGISNYLTQDEQQLIKNSSYDFIDESIEGADWVNNEGGYGTVNIDLEFMTADVNYNQRTTEEYGWSDISIFEA